MCLLRQCRSKLELDRILRILAPVALWFATVVAGPCGEPGSFSYQWLCSRAKALSAGEYHPEKRPELPESLKKLSYDDYQAIRFVPTQGPWQNENLRFTFQFFHRGFIYHDPVRMHLVDQAGVRDFSFSPQQFEYPKEKAQVGLPPDLNFAGVRVLYPINAQDRQDEVVSFLGASYFRLIGAHQRYGASARGLAIDTAEPGGEEFPAFTDFWIEKPGALAVSVRVYALLDSPSAAGAYQFVISPGEITQMDVEATLFLRKDVKKIGVGALTSMFMIGENRTKLLPDFRPEVHDSDGLLIETEARDWLWRPLINPEKDHVVTPFPVVNLTGFGLLQRDRQFDHYQDLVGRYETRPSLWLEPRGDWGTGTVELVEIPSPVEYNDNMVAYWVPGTKTVRGQQLHWTYRLSASTVEPGKATLLRVGATRVSPEHDKTPTRFVVDFTNDPAVSIPADAAVETSVHASHGTVRNVVTEKNAVTGGWRSVFDLADPGSKPVELRLSLHQGKVPVSETWAYRYPSP
jgi:periplasmic glucans biosynthesis protein